MTTRQRLGCLIGRGVVVKDPHLSSDALDTATWENGHEKILIT